MTRSIFIHFFLSIFCCITINTALAQTFSNSLITGSANDEFRQRSFSQAEGCGAAFVVAGIVEGEGNGSDCIYFARLDNDGNIIGSPNLICGPNNSQLGENIEIIRMEECAGYALATSINTNNSGWSALMMRLNTNGTVNWTRRVVGNSGWNSYGRSLMQDASSQLVMVGNVTNGLFNNLLVSKISPIGSPVATKHYRTSVDFEQTATEGRAIMHGVLEGRGFQTPYYGVASLAGNYTVLHIIGEDLNLDAPAISRAFDLDNNFETVDEPFNIGDDLTIVGATGTNLNNAQISVLSLSIASDVTNLPPNYAKRYNLGAGGEAAYDVSPRGNGDFYYVVGQHNISNNGQTGAAFSMKLASRDGTPISGISYGVEGYQNYAQKLIFNPDLTLGNKLAGASWLNGSLAQDIWVAGVNDDGDLEDASCYNQVFPTASDLPVTEIFGVDVVVDNFNFEMPTVNFTSQTLSANQNALCGVVECVADFNFQPANTTFASCESAIIIFSNQSTGSNLTYNWRIETPDGVINTRSENANATYTANGCFNATLTITDEIGCESSITKEVCIEGLVGVNFETTINCLAVNFQNTSINTSLYNWDFGDGQISGAINPNHTYEKPGVYLVCVTGSDGSSCEMETCEEITVESCCCVSETVLCEQVERGFELRTDCGLLTVIPVDLDPCETVTWTWGDGQSGPTTTGNQSNSHTYNTDGDFVVCMQVRPSSTNGGPLCDAKTFCDTITIQTDTQISGFIYEDENGNGAADSGEGLLTDIDVYLLQGTTIIEETKSVNGFYIFDDLVAGNYTVQTISSQYIATPSSLTVTVDDCVVSTNNNFFLAPQDLFGSIGGAVIFDLNGNGEQDYFEKGIANLEITIAGNDTKIVLSDDDGFFYAGLLLPGNYAVTLNGQLNNGTLISSSSFNLTLAEGQHIDDILFRFAPLEGTASFAGIAAYDLDADGILDPENAVLIGGLTVVLLDSANNFVTSIETDKNGIYCLIGQPAGSYTVFVETPVENGEAIPPTTFNPDLEEGGFSENNFLYKATDPLLSCGTAVMTQYAKTDDDYSLVLADVRNLSSYTKGHKESLGGTTPTTAWKRSNLGQVFGLAVGQGNVLYVAATSIYGADFKGGTIHRIDPTDFSVTPLINIPTASKGFGNITYDPNNNQLFATDFANGTIIRVEINGAIGTVAETYNFPGTTTFNSIESGFANLGERLWGIGYNPDEGRLYFGVWKEDFYEDKINNIPPRFSTAYQNEIWSIDIDDNSGAFNGLAKEEFKLDNISRSKAGSGPVSDIAFKADGTMLLAEKPMYGDTHLKVIQDRGLDLSLSRVLEYSGNSNNYTQTRQIFIGNYGKSINAAGGVSYGFGYDSSEKVDLNDEQNYYWATGNYLRRKGTSNQLDPGDDETIYGLASIPGSGNTRTNVKSTSYYFKFKTDAEGQYGDVEVFCSSPIPEDLCKDFTITATTSSGSILACANETLTLNTNITGNTGTVTCSWSPATNLSSTSTCFPVFTAPAVTTVQAITYQVIATDDAGCKDTAEITLEIFPEPNIAITASDTICQGTDLQFSETGGSATAWKWVGGNFDNINSQNPTILAANLPAPGQHTFCVDITDNRNCANTICKVITIAATNDPFCVNCPGGLVINSIDRSSPFLCAGQSITLTANANSTTSTIVDYQWTGPNGFAVNGIGPHTISAMGNYTLTVTDDLGCMVSETIFIEEIAAPEVAVANNGPLCPDATLALTENGGEATSWTWTGPSGAVFTPNANVQNPNVTPIIAGNYTVVVENGNGCTNMATTTVAVLPANDPACIECPGSLAFNSFTPSSLGICPTSGTSPTLSAIATGGTPTYTYKWELDNAPINLTNQTLIITAAGQYCVTITDQNECFVTDCITVEAFDNPQPIISNNSPLCPNETLQLQETSNEGDSWVWTSVPPLTFVGNGTATPSVSNITPGSYAITVEIDNNGCKGTTSSTVTVRPDNHPDCINCPGTLTFDNFNPDNPVVCKNGGTTQLTANASGGVGSYNYDWDYNGNPTGSNSSNITVSNSGLYCVTITDENDCKVNACITVTAECCGNLEVSTLSDTTICENESLVLLTNITSGQAPFACVWTPTTGLSSATDCNPTISGLSPGTYTYTVNVTDADTCTGSASVTITVLPASDADCGGNTDCSDFVFSPFNPNVVDLCTTGGSAPITANHTGGVGPFTYRWTLNGNSIGGNNNPITANTAGLYCVTIIDSRECAVTGCVEVLADCCPDIIVETIPDTVICGEDIIVLSTVISGGTAPYSCAWSPATGLSATNSCNPTVSGLSPGTYNYVVIVTDMDGCTGMNNVTVTVQPDTACVDCPYETVFTPNGNTPPATLINGTKCWDFNVNTSNNGNLKTVTFCAAGYTFSNVQVNLANTNFSLNATNDELSIFAFGRGGWPPNAPPMGSFCLSGELDTCDIPILVKYSDIGPLDFPILVCEEPATLPCDSVVTCCQQNIEEFCAEIEQGFDIFFSTFESDSCEGIVQVEVPNLTDCRYYQIDWGDGNIDGPVQSAQLPFNHDYAEPGTYPVCLLVFERDGVEICLEKEVCDTIVIPGCDCEGTSHTSAVMPSSQGGNCWSVDLTTGNAPFKSLKIDLSGTGYTIDQNSIIVTSGYGYDYQQSAPDELNVYVFGFAEAPNTNIPNVVEFCILDAQGNVPDSCNVPLVIKYFNSGSTDIPEYDCEEEFPLECSCEKETLTSTFSTILIESNGFDFDGQDVIENNNSELVLLDDGFIDGFSITFMESNGDWKNTWSYKIITDSTFISAQKIINIDDSNNGNPNAYAIIGTLHKIGTQERQMVFMKLDYSGNIYFSKAFNTPNNALNGYSIIQSKSKDILLIGTEEQSNRRDDLFLTLLDANTNLVWSKSISAGTRVFDSFSARKGIEIEGLTGINPHFAILGSGPSFSGTDTELVIINGNGDVQFGGSIGLSRSNILNANRRFEIPVDLLQRQNGDIAILSNFAPDAANSNHKSSLIHILKQDNTNPSSFTEENFLFNRPRQEDFSPAQFVEDGNGQLIITGEDLNNFIGAFQISADLSQVHWANKYTFNGRTETRTATHPSLITKDGGHIILGSLNDGFGDDLLTKTDLLGNFASCDCKDTISVEGEQVEVARGSREFIAEDRNQMFDIIIERSSVELTQEFCDQNPGPPSCDQKEITFTESDNPDGTCCFNIDLDIQSPNTFTKLRFTPLNGTAEFVNQNINGLNYNFDCNTSTCIELVANAGNTCPSGDIYLPTGGDNPLSFCLREVTNTNHQILVEWLDCDSTVCTDTLSMECFDCVEILNDSIYCSEEEGQYKYIFELENKSDREICFIEMEVLDPVGGNIVPNNVIEIFPCIQPGQTYKDTICLEGIPSRDLVKIAMNYAQVPDFFGQICSDTICIETPACCELAVSIPELKVCDTLEFFTINPVITGANGATTCTWTGPLNPQGCNPKIPILPPGVYTYCVTVTDALGCVASTCVDVTVWHCPNPCIEICNEALTCIENQYQFTFDLKNNTDKEICELYIPPAGGVTFTPNPIQLTTCLQPGDTLKQQVVFVDGIMAGDSLKTVIEVSFPPTEAIRLSGCVSEEICLGVPECNMLCDSLAMTNTFSTSIFTPSNPEDHNNYASAGFEDVNTGEFVMGGWTINFPSLKRDLQLSKLNQNGTLIQTCLIDNQVYSGETLTEIIPSQFTTDYILTGYAETSTEGNVFLKKVDQNCNLVCGIMIGKLATAEYGYDLVEDSNGDILTVGNSSTPGTTGNVFITKVDNNCKLLWANQYLLPANAIAFSITELKNSNFTGSGPYYAITGVVPGQLFLLIINQAGTIVNSQTHTFTNGFTPIPDQILENQNGEIIIAGGISTASISYPYFLKLTQNPQGQYNVTRSFYYNSPSNDERAKSITQTSDGNFVLAGNGFFDRSQTSTIYEKGQAILFKVSSDGSQVLWANTYFDNNFEGTRFFKVNPTQDNGLFAVGTSSETHPVFLHQNNFYSVKTDEFGKVTSCDCYKPMEISAIEVTVTKSSLEINTSPVEQTLAFEIETKEEEMVQEFCQQDKGSDAPCTHAATINANPLAGNSCWSLDVTVGQGPLKNIQLCLPNGITFDPGSIVLSSNTDFGFSLNPGNTELTVFSTGFTWPNTFNPSVVSFCVNGASANCMIPLVVKYFDSDPLDIPVFVCEEEVPLSCSQNLCEVEIETKDTTICEGEIITLSSNLIGGTAPFTCIWSPTTGLTSANSCTPTVSGLTAGTYVYTVSITDANGCMGTGTTTVRVLSEVDCPTRCTYTTESCFNPIASDTTGKICWDFNLDQDVSLLVEWQFCAPPGRIISDVQVDVSSNSILNSGNTELRVRGNNPPFATWGNADRPSVTFCLNGSVNDCNVPLTIKYLERNEIDLPEIVCQEEIQLNCETKLACCQDFEEFCAQVDQGFDISFSTFESDSCEGLVTIEVPNLTDCRFYQIDWGDGQMDGPFQSTQLPFNHDYTQSGTYPICLVVSERDGTEICFEKEVCDTIVVPECGECEDPTPTIPTFSTVVLGEDNFWAVAENTQNQFAVVASEGFQHTTLSILDNQGNLQNTWKYIDQDASRFNYMQEIISYTNPCTGNSGYALTGTRYHRIQPNPTPQLVFFKMDENGTIYEAQSINDNSSNTMVGTDLVQASNGDLLIVGHEDFPNREVNLYLVYDNCQTKWEKSIKVGPRFYNPKVIEVTQLNGTVGSGPFYAILGDGNTILVINANGDVQFGGAFVISELSTNQLIGNDLVQLANGKIIVVGSNLSQDKTILVELSQDVSNNFVVTNAAQLDLPAGDKFEVNDVHVSAGDVLTIGGIYNNAGAGAFQINSNLSTFNWSNKYEFNGNLTGRINEFGSSPTSDNGWLWVGGGFNLTNTFALKSDFSGDLSDCDCQDTLQFSNEKIEVLVEKIETTSENREQLVDRNYEKETVVFEQNFCSTDSGTPNPPPDTCLYATVSHPAPSSGGSCWSLNVNNVTGALSSVAFCLPAGFTFDQSSIVLSNNTLFNFSLNGTNTELTVNSNGVTWPNNQNLNVVTFCVNGADPDCRIPLKVKYFEHGPFPMPDPVCEEEVILECYEEDCVIVTKDSLYCNPEIDGQYKYEFEVFNNTNQTICEFLVNAYSPSGINVTPNPIILNPNCLQPNQTTTQIVCLDGIMAGDEVKIILEASFGSNTGPTLDMQGCVSDTLCLEAPTCCDTCDLNFMANNINIKEDSCCYSLDFDICQDDLFTGLKITPLTPGVTLEHQSGIGGWFIASGSNQTMATWLPPAPQRFISAGQHNGNIQFCLGGYTQSPQTVLVEWLGGPNNGVLCRDTIISNCTPPDENGCAEVTDTLICLEDGRYQLDIKVTNKSNFDARRIEIRGLDSKPTGGVFAPSPPILITQNLPQDSCIQLPPVIIDNVNAGDSICYSIVLVSPTTGGYFDCCHTDTMCVVVPNCEGSCDDLIAMTNEVDSCCYSVDLKNNYGANIIKFEAEILTPNWIFNIGALPGGASFQWGTPQPTGRKFVVEHSSGFIPLGTSTGALDYCLSATSPTAATNQTIVYRWYEAVAGGDTLVTCTDTVVVDCPIIDVQDACVVMEDFSIVCDPDNPEEYVLNFRVRNLSNFSANWVTLHDPTSGILFSNCPTGIPTSQLDLLLSPNPLPPNTVSNTLCAKIIANGPITMPTIECFRLSLGSPTDCCHAPRLTCITLPVCCEAPPCPPACITVTNDSLYCNPDLAGQYKYTFDVTNNSTADICEILMNVLQPGGITATPMLIDLTPNCLAPGQSTTQTVCLDGLQAGDDVKIILENIFGTGEFDLLQGCVSDTLCLEAPACCDICDLNVVVNPRVVQEDSCCYSIDFDICQDSILLIAKVTVLTPGTSMTNPMTRAGWQIIPGGSTGAAWTLNGPPFFMPQGQYTDVIQFCLEGSTQSPQRVLIEWLDLNQNTVCTDTIITNCPVTPTDTCVCTPWEDFTVTFPNGNNPPITNIQCGDPNIVLPNCEFEFCLDGQFGCESDTCAAFHNWTLTKRGGGQVNPLSTAQPGNVFKWCWDVASGTGPANATGPGLYDLRLNGSCGDTGCDECLLTFEIPICDTIPTNCTPCDEIDYIVSDTIVNGDSCCFVIDILNPCLPSQFTGVGTEIITGAVFSHACTPDDWYFSTMNSASNYDWFPKPGPPHSTTLPSGLLDSKVTICMDKFSTDSAEVAIKLYEDPNKVACIDTLKFFCPERSSQCVDIDSAVKCTDGIAGIVHSVDLTVTNQTIFNVESIMITELHTKPSGGTFSPLPPISVSGISLPPGGMQQMPTINVLGSNFNEEVCFEVVMYNNEVPSNECCHTDTICIVLDDPSCTFIANPLTEEQEIRPMKNTTSFTSKIKVYPNPFGDRMSVELNQPLATDARIIIYDLQGQRVLTQDWNKSDHKTTLEVNQLPAGLYLLKVFIGEEVFFEKIVKQ